MKTIFAALIFVAVAAHADAKKKCFPLPTPIIDPPPSECGKNEVFSECAATGCQSTCEYPDLQERCLPERCVAGCICKEGYLRDSNRNCIPAEKCPNACKGPNESYNSCGTACPLTCDEPLPRPCSRQCVEGCFCDPGYVRNKKGRCVLPEDCPKPTCKKPNESYNSCGTACPLTCENPTPGICTKQCVAGCFCDDGYVRDSIGDCVLAEDCPAVPVCTKAHETYTECGSACPLTCEKLNLPPMNCITLCVPGCFCDAGYARNSDGDCILKEECPAVECTKPHESYTVGTECPPTCENPTPFCNKKGVYGCFCDEGYVRDSNGDCILLEDCPAVVPVCSKAHESYMQCGTACPLTCDEPFPRPCTKQCVSGCFCDKGYVRDKKGNCVLPEDCPDPKCKGPKESYNRCGTACPLTCDEPLPRPCTEQCVSGCFCNEGYVRNKRGKCVLPENCPAPKCKRRNESYMQCGTACPLTCDEPLPRPCTMQCVSGCFCDKGYLRNKKGRCVSPEDCPKPECGKNENYNDCGASPCQATCENPNLPLLCKAPCIPGCGCNDGYVRDKDGKCIKLKKCPPLLECGENEVYEACSTLCGEPTCDRSEPLYCGVMCEPRCLCKKNFVRNAENVCIKAKHCPK